MYVGIVPTLIGIVPLMALQFGSYEAFKQAIKNTKAPPGVDPDTVQLSFMEQSVSGFSAGILSKFLTMPLDVIKKRFQVSGFEMPLVSTPKAHTVHRAVLHTPPIPAAVTAGMQVPSTTPHATVPTTKSSVLSHTHPTSAAGTTVPAATPLSSTVNLSSSRLTSAHSSSITPPHTPSMPAPAMKPTSGFSSVFATPMEILEPLRSITRRRRPLDKPVAGRRPFTGVWDCARGIYAHEGINGLFKGSIPSMLKAGPNSAIIYMVYEYTIRWLNQDFDANGNGNGNHKHKP
jgi:hypothetical protein